MPDLMSRWSNASPEQLLAKANQHLPFWVSLLLVALIGYYLARIGWLLYPVDAGPLWTPPQVVATQSATPAGNPESYESIVAAHLFGTASAEVAPEPAETTEDAPDTRLNLKLRATVSADDQEIAHAIIADSSGTEKVYFVKDSIPGGATLHQVQIDRVILNRGGVLEALRLPKDFDGTASGLGRSTARTSAARGASNSDNNLQQIVASNAANFAQIIRPQPFMPNGQLKGYRVFPGRNRQQFIALGLRPGDLVTEVNGIALNNPAQGMEIFRTLSESSQVTVTVERNGQRQELSLDASDIGSVGETTR